MAVIQAAYFAVLAIGGDPTRREIQEMTKRICGKTMQSKDVCAFLRAKRLPVPLQSQPSTKPVPSPSTKSDVPVPTQSQASTAPVRVAKVLELELEASPPPVKPVKPAREDKRTDAEKTADAAMLLLLARIQPYLHGMTVTTWRRQNRRVVVDMVQSGMTVPEIDAAHDHIRDGAGNPYVVLDWFQKKLAVQGVKPPEPERVRGIDTMTPEQRDAMARRELARRVAAGES